MRDVKFGSNELKFDQIALHNFICGAITGWLELEHYRLKGALRNVKCYLALREESF